MGVIKWHDLFYYLKAMGPLALPILCLLWKITVHVFNVFYEIRLAAFAATTENFQWNVTHDRVYDSFLWYVGTYAATFSLDIGVSIYFYHLLVNGNKKLHDRALHGVVKSPMLFFNINFWGVESSILEPLGAPSPPRCLQCQACWILQHFMLALTNCIT